MLVLDVACEVIFLLVGVALLAVGKVVGVVNDDLFVRSWRINWFPLPVKRSLY